MIIPNMGNVLKPFALRLFNKLSKSGKTNKHSTDNQQVCILSEDISVLCVWLYSKHSCEVRWVPKFN